MYWVALEVGSHPAAMPCTYFAGGSQYEASNAMPTDLGCGWCHDHFHSNTAAAAAGASLPAYSCGHDPWDHRWDLVAWFQGLIGPSGQMCVSVGG